MELLFSTKIRKAPSSTKVLLQLLQALLLIIRISGGGGRLEAEAEAGGVQLDNPLGRQQQQQQQRMMGNVKRSRVGKK